MHVTMSLCVPHSFGSVTHALWAKGNLDIERSTPGSNSDDPAYVRQAAHHLHCNHVNMAAAPRTLSSSSPPFPPAEILNTYETFMLISFLFSSSFVFPIYFSLQEDSDRNNKYTRVCLSCLCGFVIKTQSRKRRRVGILFDFIPDVNFRERSSVESGDCININNKPLPGTIHIYTPSREFV